MARTTTEDAQIMRECQRGLERDMSGPTGAVCRARDKCYAERRCYFVYRVEAYLEQHAGKWAEPAPPRRRGGTPNISLRKRRPEPVPDRLLSQLALEM